MDYRKNPQWMYERKLPARVQTTTIDQDAVEFVLADAIVEALTKKLDLKGDWHIVSTGTQICVYAPTTKDNHKYGVKYLKFFIDVKCLHIMKEDTVEAIAKMAKKEERRHAAKKQSPHSV